MVPPPLLFESGTENPSKLYKAAIALYFVSIRLGMTVNRVVGLQNYYFITNKILHDVAR